MTIYTINLIMSTAINYFSRKMNKRTAMFFLGISILVVSLVAGLRYGVGTDYFEYVKWFNVYAAVPIKLKDGNISFNILIKTIKLFTNNPQWLFFISAIIINSRIMRYIKENTELYDIGFFLFITLYFYYSSLNIMRQWIAIAIFVSGLKYIFDQKLFKYILMISFATTFHPASLLMLPLYFIVNTRINIKKMMIIVFVSLLILAHLQNIIIFIVVNFNLTSFHKYINYFDSYYATTQGGGWAYFVILFFVFLLMLVYKKSYMKHIKNGNAHYILMILALMISLFAPQNMIFARIQLFFMPIILITLPNVITILKPRYRIVLTMIVLLLGVLYMFRSLSNNAGHVLPYVSIF